MKPLLLAARERRVPTRGDPDSGIIDFSLFNNGLGPAIVSSYGFRLDGNWYELRTREDLGAIKAAIGVKSGTTQFNVISPGEPIPAGAKMDLFRIEKVQCMDGFDVDAALRRLQLCIEYRTIYDELRKVII